MESFLRRADAFGHGADLKTFTQEAKLGGKRERRRRSTKQTEAGVLPSSEHELSLVAGNKTPPKSGEASGQSGAFVSKKDTDLIVNP